MARNAAAPILVHNLPSGVVEPSRADEHLTQTLKAAPSLVDVRALINLIVAGRPGSGGHLLRNVSQCNIAPGILVLLTESVGLDDSRVARPIHAVLAAD